MLRMVGGWKSEIPMKIQPWNRPFWPRFIYLKGPAKSQPTNVDPIDRSLLANFVEPFIAKLQVKHDQADKIHAEQIAKLNF